MKWPTDKQKGTAALPFMPQLSPQIVKPRKTHQKNDPIYIYHSIAPIRWGRKYIFPFFEVGDPQSSGRTLFTIQHSARWDLRRTFFLPAPQWYTLEQKIGAAWFRKHQTCKMNILVLFQQKVVKPVQTTSKKLANNYLVAYERNLPINIWCLYTAGMWESRNQTVWGPAQKKHVRFSSQKPVASLLGYVVGDTRVHLFGAVEPWQWGSSPFGVLSSSETTAPSAISILSPADAALEE